MDYEEKTVFKYVDALLENNAPKNYQISTFSKHHDQVGEKLTELKNIIIKYCPAKANTNLLNAALFDIYACEEGLESHCKVEDYIFVPAILKLERRIRENEKDDKMACSMCSMCDGQCPGHGSRSTGCYCNTDPD